jgi:molybdenum cofactor guanylyltransferase
MAEDPRDERSWSAAILAGGRATRLGGQVKALLPVDGTPMLARLLVEVGTLGAAAVVVAPEAAPFAGLGVRVVQDSRPGDGPLGALFTALEVATTPHVVVLAGDLPFVSAAFLAHLVSLRHDADAVVPRDAGGWHPLCACYGRHLAPAIARRLARGDLAVTAALDDWHVRAVTPGEIARFDPDGALLWNVNTPDDYDRARALARARRGTRT